MHDYDTHHLWLRWQPPPVKWTLAVMKGMDVRGSPPLLLQTMLEHLIWQGGPFCCSKVSVKWCQLTVGEGDYILLKTAKVLSVASFNSLGLHCWNEEVYFVVLLLSQSLQQRSIEAPFYSQLLTCLTVRGPNRMLDSLSSQPFFPLLCCWLGWCEEFWLERKKSAHFPHLNLCGSGTDVPLSIAF